MVVSGAACDDDSSVAAKVTPTTAAPVVTGEVVVLAAASLTEAFTEIRTAFQARYPQARVKFSFGSSSSLATQANQGAPADVFASADEGNMKKVTDVGTATKARTFVRNRLAILVGKGNPRTIAGLVDFQNVVYILCAVGVPCGTYGEEALEKAGLDTAAHPPKSRVENVKAVVNLIKLGEADAGIVYVTDAKASADDTDSLDIPDDHNVTAVYPMAGLKQAPNAPAGAAFMDFVLSPAGQDILAKYGFLRAS